MCMCVTNLHVLRPSAAAGVMEEEAEEGGSRDDFVVSFDGNSNQQRLLRLFTEAQIYYTPMTGEALELVK